MERDRRTVDSWDLKTVTRDMWFETEDYDAMCELISNEVPDMEYAKYSSPEVVKEAVYQYFRKENPDAVMAETQSELEQKVKQGLTVYVGGGAFNVVE